MIHGFVKYIYMVNFPLPEIGQNNLNVQAGDCSEPLNSQPTAGF